jgi:hypothetical protein
MRHFQNVSGQSSRHAQLTDIHVHMKNLLYVGVAIIFDMLASWQAGSLALTTFNPAYNFLDLFPIDISKLPKELEHVLLVPTAPVLPTLGGNLSSLLALMTLWSLRIFHVVDAPSWLWLM